MSYKKIFWGVLLILIGVLFILKNLGIVYFNWWTIWNLWPLLLILWGVSIIPVSNGIKLILSGVAIVAAFMLVDKDDHRGFHFRFDNGVEFYDDETRENSHYDWNDKQTLHATYENTPNALLKLNAGAGHFMLRETTENHLALFEKEGNIGRYSMKTRTSGDIQVINFGLENDHIRIGDNTTNRVRILLNPEPVWSLELNIGAAELDFDLSPFCVSNLDLNGGASDIDIKIGHACKETKIDVDAGVSSLILRIPKESGARLDVSAFLVGKSLDGFTKEGGYYQTDNFEDADNKIFINIDTAISSFEINRY
jgi:hypothetical protein